MFEHSPLKDLIMTCHSFKAAAPLLSNVAHSPISSLCCSSSTLASLPVSQTNQLASPLHTSSQAAHSAGLTLRVNCTALHAFASCPPTMPLGSTMITHAVVNTFEPTAPLGSTVAHVVNSVAEGKSTTTRSDLLSIYRVVQCKSNNNLPCTF